MKGQSENKRFNSVCCLFTNVHAKTCPFMISFPFFYFYNLDNRTSLKNTGLLETDHSTNFKVIIIKSKCSIFSPFQILEEKAFSNQNKNKKKAKTQQQNFFQDFQPKKLGYGQSIVSQSCNSIQLMPALKVNIIIVHPRGVVFPEGFRFTGGKTTSQG